ncbi:MAG: D-aminoacyl-tRNA deacylase [Lautropia sp.]|nr:D-aminoacyl-tRNA deacylase [Lautropia sp.]
MYVLVQRVRQATVRIDEQIAGHIDRGLLVFICAEPNDTHEHARRAVAKLLKLRVFADDAGKMNKSVQDIDGALLIVSQFTLAADVWQGNRPSFTGAAPAALGEALYDQVVTLAREQHPTVETGRFGADMQISLMNDGPVTIPFRVL